LESEQNCALLPLTDKFGLAGSFAGLGFLSLYLSGKIKVFDRKGHVAKLCIVFLPLLVACMVGISRVDDYWHHWQDVFAGGLLGLSFKIRNPFKKQIISETHIITLVRFFQVLLLLHFAIHSSSLLLIMMMVTSLSLCLLSSCQIFVYILICPIVCFCKYTPNPIIAQNNICCNYKEAIIP
jgi:hypothetical protein